MKKRIKRLIINPVAFISIMKNGTTWRVFEGIPSKAELVGATLDSQTQNFILFIQDESFELVNVQEEVAPLLVLEVRKVI
jgi:hypothetical protein